MTDKAYNTHLVKLWLDNNHKNFMACKDMNNKKFRAIMHNDSVLMTWLYFRNYGLDTDKVKLDKDMLYLSDIRQTIINNRGE